MEKPPDFFCSFKIFWRLIYIHAFPYYEYTFNSVLQKSICFYYTYFSTSIQINIKTTCGFLSISIKNKPEWITNIKQTTNTILHVKYSVVRQVNTKFIHHFVFSIIVTNNIFRNRIFRMVIFSICNFFGTKSRDFFGNYFAVRTYYSKKCIRKYGFFIKKILSDKKLIRKIWVRKNLIRTNREGGTETFSQVQCPLMFCKCRNSVSH